MQTIVPDYQTPKRMAEKLAAIPLPDFEGKTVLDIGCDMGFWSFKAAEEGAVAVLGLDRNREVRGSGLVDLVAENNAAAIRARRPCRFENIDIGKQWREFGRFDAVMLFSVYHHIYANCGSHEAAWFWLSRHVEPDGVLLWEGPVDARDPVVRMNVPDHLRDGYTEKAILTEATRYFRMDYVGPALHEDHRFVYRCVPWERWEIALQGRRTSAGSGGATKAFLHANGRRMDEIERVLGVRPVPGSLNLHVDGFDWDHDYYRAEILDVVSRRAGLDGEWAPRWARFYPLQMNGIPAWAFRFEGERYAGNFVELIAGERLSDHIQDEVILCR